VTASPSLAIERGTSTSLGRLVGIGFVLLLASTNAITPLLPLYRERFGLDQFGSSTVFAIYMFVLAPTLWLCARPRVQRAAGTLLPLALVIIVGANLLMASGSLPALYAGRAVSGLAIGIGTGAAATLALSALGERGRTVAATGNLIGAVLGTTLSAVTAQWTSAPLSTVFWILSVLAAVVAVALMWSRRRHPIELAASDTYAEPDPDARLPAAEQDVATGGDDRRARISGYITGCAAWAVVMVALVAVPGSVRETLQIDSPVVSGVVALLFLVAGAVAQFAILRFPRAFGPVAVLSYLSAGVIVIGVGLASASLPLIAIGMIVAGVGNGAGYRVGMALVTRGYGPSVHGALTSRYVFIAYFVGGAAVLASSAFSTELGAVNGWWITAVAVIAACAVAAAVRGAGGRSAG
jgi:hypothetical protein